jgi:hypothetical protein
MVLTWPHWSVYDLAHKEQLMPEKKPQVQSTQVMMRIFFQDGTMAAVLTPLEPVQQIAPLSIFKQGEVITKLKAQAESALTRINDLGTDGLYEEAKREAATRRAQKETKAELARDKHLSRMPTNAEQPGDPGQA